MNQQHQAALTQCVSKSTNSVHETHDSQTSLHIFALHGDEPLCSRISSLFCLGMAVTKYLTRELEQ